jgi:hypothetical protein
MYIDLFPLGIDSSKEYEDNVMGGFREAFDRLLPPQPNIPVSEQRRRFSLDAVCVHLTRFEVNAPQLNRLDRDGQNLVLRIGRFSGKVVPRSRIKTEEKTAWLVVSLHEHDEEFGRSMTTEVKGWFFSKSIYGKSSVEGRFQVRDRKDRAVNSATKVLDKLVSLEPERHTLYQSSAPVRQFLSPDLIYFAK